MITAKIIADSKNTKGDRLTTFVLRFPRFILAELNTHRMFSRNSASSRAIPFKKMVKMVTVDPFIPIAWQKDHKGMQGTKYWTTEDNIKVTKGDGHEVKYEIHQSINYFITQWMTARDLAIDQAYELNKSGVTKQLCNRLLEPFMWHTVIVTSTEWENFFNLRCPQYEYKGEVFKSKKECINSYTKGLGKAFKKDRDYLNSLTALDWLQINKGQAEIHISLLAEAMWDAYNESKPKQLEDGEWHIPFGDNIDILKACKLSGKSGTHSRDGIENIKIKIATARCARISYNNFEGKDDYEADIKLYSRLKNNGHASPFEHVARAMNNEEYDHYIKAVSGDIQEGGWCRNFKGFIQLREIKNL